MKLEIISSSVSKIGGLEGMKYELHKVPIKSIPLYTKQSKQWKLISFYSTLFPSVLSIQTQPR